MIKDTQQPYDVIIAGGGLAGLTAAILLSAEFNVLLIDPDDYPRHKMCGEYLSAEVIPFLKSIGINIDNISDVNLSRLKFSSEQGLDIECKLPLGGKGISRYSLDHSLFKKVAQTSTTILKSRVVNIKREQDGLFIVSTRSQKIKARQVLMATGKRSNLDKSLDREFINAKSSWMAVKMHYRYEMDQETVALHNFESGYAGMSRVENGLVNLCYLARTDLFKQYRDVDAFNVQHLASNRHLKTFFKEAQPVWEKPITISQISFDKKKPIKDGILMIGDTAGLIHPLCGNGQAMAIHSAQIASRVVSDYLKNRISAKQMERSYCREWQSTFSTRLRYGRWLQFILLNPFLTKIAFLVLRLLP
ncbi:MAG: NAD(P)/FAD-dependent oxidoreductase, partial [Nonlabens sp.]